MTDFADSGRAAPTSFRTGHGAEARRIALFVVVGLLGLAVDAGVFTGLFDAGVSRAAARALSLAAATLLTYALNRGITFARAAAGRRARSEFARYVLVTLVSQGTSYGLFLVLSVVLPALPALAALMAGAAAATVLSFTGQRLFTFRVA